MARVVRFAELGGPEVLELKDVEGEVPGPGEVRIRVRAIGINRSEAMFRRGEYWEQPKFPAGLGYEAAGTVDAVGSGVTGFAIGQPVASVGAFSMNEYGTYGDLVVLPATSVVPMPTDIDPVAGAAAWVSYLAAYGMLVEFGGLRAGDAVLITAASSGVGLAAIQVAHRVGAVPIATTRTSAKRQRLLAAGASEVIVTEEDDLVGRVLHATGGRGADLVIDPIAGPGVEILARATKPAGMLINSGALSGLPTPLPTANPYFTPIVTRPFILMEILYDPQRLRRGVAFVNSGLRSGAIAPVVDRTFDLIDIVGAHRYLESNQQFGKIVVTTDA
ncbi:zinc-dependent alcohol dehydrogenase family protein [Nocardia sp. NPDC051570]|uniref:zinc-dependent alcohol dehydrogenase family protein n=1 Tax=Nocardia sp. NPDC051570 TaxID=3364324 RepID=UPI0037B0DAD0